MTIAKGTGAYIYPPDTESLAFDGATGDAVFSNRLGVSAGEASDAHVDADDLVIGDGTGKSGLTVFMGATGEAACVFTSIAGQRRGGMRYLASDEVLRLRSGGYDQVLIDGNSLRPNGNGALGIGSAAKRWTDGFMDRIHLGGADAGDAATTADSLVIGDGSATDVGMTFFAGAGQTVRWAIADSVGGADMNMRWVLPGTLIMRLNNGDRYYWTKDVHRPAAGQAIDLGDTTQAWNNLRLDGSATLDSNDAQVTIGNGAGYPKLDLNKDGTTSCDVKFQSDGVNRWILRHNNTEDLFFNRRDSGGASIDNPFLMRASTGNIEIQNDIIARAGLDLEAASPTLSMGDGTGAPQISVDKGDTSAATVALQSGGSDKWKIVCDASEDFRIERWDTGGLVDAAVVSTSDGVWTLPNELAVSGASKANGPAGADDLVIGDGSGDYGLTIFTNDAGTAKINATDATGSEVGTIDYAHSSNTWSFGTAGSVRMQIDSAGIRPSSNGADDLGSSSAAWGELWLTDFVDIEESAGVPGGAPSAGDGKFWVRADSPNTAMFTDDAGKDHPLSLWELHFAASDGDLPGVSPATLYTGSSGLSGRAVLDFSSSATNQVFFKGQLPRAYSGNGLTLRIWYVGTGSNAKSNSVVYEASFERHSSGQDMSVTSFATYQSVTTTPNSTASYLNEADIVFTNSQIDGLAAGESFELALQRTPGNASDTYLSTTQIIGITLMENP